jgi:hypothetical protein
MSDRVFLSSLAVIALAMIVLALVWPQGLGDRSPRPFGHPVAKPAAVRKSETTPSLLPIVPSVPPATP